MRGRQTVRLVTAGTPLSAMGSQNADRRLRIVTHSSRERGNAESTSYRKKNEFRASVLPRTVRRLFVSACADVDDRCNRQHALTTMAPRKMLVVQSMHAQQRQL
jgi:hypothetical protein